VLLTRVISFSLLWAKSLTCGSRYGEDTGNSACTYYEYKHAVDRKKRIILVRMIPFDQDFVELQARVIFGANKLVLPWMEGEPMPDHLPDDIANAMGVPAPEKV
jgi:hypothetical protein